MTSALPEDAGVIPFVEEDFRTYVMEMIDKIDFDRKDYEKYDAYAHGHMDDPWAPKEANDEYRRLVDRCKTPWCPTIINIPVQASTVDAFTFGANGGNQSDADWAWEHWQRSRLDSLQSPIYRASATFGVGYVVTEARPEGTITRSLSTIKTTAIFDDPGSDIDPVAALTIFWRPGDTGPDRQVRKLGQAYAWDRFNLYSVTWEVKDKPTITEIGPHGGNGLCPVSRFPCFLDVDGRVTGLIEPMIPVQDLFNQTTFDLLLNQTFNSFNVRTATGMIPPTKKVWNETTQRLEDALDEDGEPIPDKIQMSGDRMLIAEAPDAKFGVLPGTPMDGFIAALESAQQRISALTQIPPFFLLGQIANVSAEALSAANILLGKKIGELQRQWGEAWERTLRVAAAIEGRELSALQIETEWDDWDIQSLSEVGDFVAKTVSQGGFPKRAARSFIPGSQRQRQMWDQWADEEEAQQEQEIERQASLQRAAAIARPNPEVTSGNGQPEVSGSD